MTVVGRSESNTNNIQTDLALTATRFLSRLTFSSSNFIFKFLTCKWACEALFEDYVSDYIKDASISCSRKYTFVSLPSLSLSSPSSCKKVMEMNMALGLLRGPEIFASMLFGMASLCSCTSS